MFRLISLEYLESIFQQSFKKNVNLKISIQRKRIQNIAKNFSSHNSSQIIRIEFWSKISKQTYLLGHVLKNDPFVMIIISLKANWEQERRFWWSVMIRFKDDLTNATEAISSIFRTFLRKIKSGWIKIKNFEVRPKIMEKNIYFTSYFLPPLGYQSDF